MMLSDGFQNPQETWYKTLQYLPLQVRISNIQPVNMDAQAAIAAIEQTLCVMGDFRRRDTEAPVEFSVGPYVLSL